MTKERKVSQRISVPRFDDVNHIREIMSLQQRMPMCGFLPRNEAFRAIDRVPQGASSYYFYSFHK